MNGTVLIDTREQDLHILKDLDSLSVPYKRRKLDYGDYSFEWNGKSYENEIIIERKATFDELIGNFTKGRKRFQNEFRRSSGCRVVLMVEASVNDLEAGHYRSNMSPRDLKSFLSTWCHKFQLRLEFIEKNEACSFILNCFKDYLKREREV